MFLIKVTAEQKQFFMEAMDIVVKATGIAELDKTLPLINAIQSADKIEDEAKKPDLKVVEGKE